MNTLNDPVAMIALFKANKFLSQTILINSLTKVIQIK